MKGLVGSHHGVNFVSNIFFTLEYLLHLYIAKTEAQFSLTCILAAQPILMWVKKNTKTRRTSFLDVWTRPKISQRQSLKICRSTNFMLFSTIDGYFVALRLWNVCKLGCLFSLWMFDSKETIIPKCVLTNILYHHAGFQNSESLFFSIFFQKSRSGPPHEHYGVLPSPVIEKSSFLIAVPGRL